jgi:hypothetical protein
MSCAISLPVVESRSKSSPPFCAAISRVESVTIVEYPVPKFVRPAELVMTTCPGCDGTMIPYLVNDPADQEAVALAVSRPPSALLTSIPSSVIDEANQRWLSYDSAKERGCYGQTRPGVDVRESLTTRNPSITRIAKIMRTAAA